MLNELKINDYNLEKDWFEYSFCTFEIRLWVKIDSGKINSWGFGPREIDIEDSQAEYMSKLIELPFNDDYKSIHDLIKITMPSAIEKAKEEDAYDEEDEEDIQREVRAWQRHCDSFMDGRA